MVEVKTNSLKAWVLAARPKTLTGAAVPVMMALSMAFVDGGWSAFKVLPAVLCFLFAFIMQIDANLINDYFDFKKGTDDEHRLGPRRACAQGWVTEHAMQRAINITTAVACVIGLPLVIYGGWWTVVIGVACVLFCFLYTIYLSYRGLGDLLVLVFFGLVPVCATYYLQTGTVTTDVIVASVTSGLVIDTLLVVNNYRDRDNDRRTGKHTLVVLIGERWTEALYFALGVIAFLLGLVQLSSGRYLTFLLPAVYVMIHTYTFWKMKKIHQGKALNQILGMTARNIFIFGLLFTAGVLLDGMV
ncbi:MAG: 1,4-dihydroxy-2-naphthoate octaprenyltransferase [Prevotella sp.]|nr:1,4-dihydroxy-2-naphthoate octaprenyltransferase [Prevotella sp.]